MNIWRLVLRELGHRKLSFLLGWLSVSVAVACLVGALTLLRADQIQTENILTEKRKAVTQAGAELEDSMRKITKGLGFNVIILPEDQDLNEMHLEGTLSQTMPESYVDRLAKSKIVTVNHLLPTIIKKLVWTEYNVPVIMYGTRGEVPLLHRDPKKPLLDAVPTGHLIAGYELGRKLKLKQGDKVRFMEREFSIIKIHDERGTADDSTVWINLREAQELLSMENLIHAIQALECHCAGERLAQIRKEIAAILPGTQVIERGPPALARAEARNKAKEVAQESLLREKTSRADLRRQREQFVGTLVPLVMIGSAIWIGFLTLGNVRQRREEIGILRAIGYRSAHILGIFIGKSLLIGVAGAILGYLGGIMVGFAWASAFVTNPSLLTLFDGNALLLALFMAPFLSVLASWVPALLAARQDPAIVLQSE